MRGPLLLVALAVATPAWAQLNDDPGSAFQERAATEAKPPSCSWCVALELSLSLGLELVGMAAGFGLTAVLGGWSGLLTVPVGAAVGLLSAGPLIASYVGRQDGHPPWIGTAIGTGFALLFGPVVAFFLISASANERSSDLRTAQLVGAVAAALLCPGFVVLAVEFERSTRVTPSVALLPGGGAVVLTATF